MINLFEIARQAQQGAGFERLGRDFGLDPAHAQRAVEALMPAFAMAFQRSAFDPAAFASLASLVGSGFYRPAFETGSRPAEPGSRALATQVFGSDEAARRISEEAASYAGIGQDVMYRMMPVVAGMLVGGMSRYATLDGLADLLRHWSDAIKSALQSRRTPAAGFPAEPWSTWARAMTGSVGERAPPPPPAPPSMPFGVWLEAVQAFWAPTPPPAPPPPAPADPALAMARMFEAGCDLQTQYVASLARIMEDAWKAPKPQ